MQFPRTIVYGLVVQNQLLIVSSKQLIVPDLTTVLSSPCSDTSVAFVQFTGRKKQVGA